MRREGYIGWIVASSLALVAPGPSRAVPPRELGVKEAADLAESHSAVLASDRSREEAAREAGQGARATRQPTFELSASASRLSEVPELSITGPGFEIRSIFPNIPDRYSTRLSFSVPLYMGGAISAGIEASDFALHSAEAGTETARADVRLEATRAWWTLVTAHETVRVLRDALASYEQHLVDARNREELGLAAANEVLSVQVERDRAELALVRAEFATERAEADLARLCGLDPATPVVPDAIPEPDLRSPAPLDTLVRSALDVRPERADLSAQRDGALARARASAAPSRPTVTADGGYEYSNPNLRVLPLEEAWKDTWDVSLRFRWTLWDGRKASHAEAQARADADAISYRLEDLDRKIRLEVTSRYLDVRESARALPVAERAVTAAAESERIAKDRYREGLLSSADLLDAETARLQAGLDRTEAMARLAVVRALLARSVGQEVP